MPAAGLETCVTRHSAREYGPVIVAALRKVGCEATAALTAKALEALALDRVTAQGARSAFLQRDGRRDRKLASYDRQYNLLDEIEPRLFAFAEAHAPEIVLEPVEVLPRPKSRGYTKVSWLELRLRYTPKADYLFDAARRLAAELATKERGITAAEIEGATYLYRQLPNGVGTGVQPNRRGLLARRLPCFQIHCEWGAILGQTDPPSQFSVT